MSAVPLAVIFVNNNVSDGVLDTLVRQLFIDYVIRVNNISDLDGYVDGYETFQDRVLIIIDLNTVSDRSLADVVVFYKSGLINILKNKFGPCLDSFPLARISWHQLGINVDNHSVF